MLRGIRLEEHLEKAKRKLALRILIPLLTYSWSLQYH